ncbi:Transcription factor rbf1 (RPG-box-binding factor) (Repressor-activator protein 1) [Scheffersomyces spartinae]|uniref:Transcription factor rbf1 (RPG-box-binding factor) (Repressor-activator protein 1) n=1 Tax=Scheffersomyces spartinae TaxID=45513 RepID=A0A9P7VE32_9ASCO|nr:Transcription factor rbf1 (RPG-box-binding factor) (Repressor-activator protein 1) [Scheffersomyces spartinae]KAG7196102.1 Transcription factor rbf1 (RPG-box-binding factor) (Repressor-activator protein 1) [Scheffersomyces spartinae]
MLGPSTTSDRTAVGNAPAYYDTTSSVAAAAAAVGVGGGSDNGLHGQVHHQGDQVHHVQAHPQQHYGGHPHHLQGDVDPTTAAAAAAAAAVVGYGGPMDDQYLAYQSASAALQQHQHQHAQQDPYQLQQQLQRQQYAAQYQYQLQQQQEQAAAAHLQQHQLQQQQAVQQMQQQAQHQGGVQGVVHQHLQQAVANVPLEEFDPDSILQSRYTENEMIKTFRSKAEMVRYVKTDLYEEEQCKIVINSSKPKAVYFQCERSGLFRTTVKDASKRQRVAYTKRNKCGYRLVANLYPTEKSDKKNTKKDDGLDDKLGEYGNGGDDGYNTGETWILRMINPVHNHPPEPPRGALGKKSKKYRSRTLVEKPLHRAGGAPNQDTQGGQQALGHQMPHDVNVQQAAANQQYEQEIASLRHHQYMPQMQHHHVDVHHQPQRDVSVMAAIASAHPNSGTLVDPSIDPNVDPSVQDHDHAHGVQ